MQHERKESNHTRIDFSDESEVQHIYHSPCGRTQPHIQPDPILAPPSSSYSARTYLASALSETSIVTSSSKSLLHRTPTPTSSALIPQPSTSRILSIIQQRQVALRFTSEPTIDVSDHARPRDLADAIELVLPNTMSVLEGTLADSESEVDDESTTGSDSNSREALDQQAELVEIVRKPRIRSTDVETEHHIQTTGYQT